MTYVDKLFNVNFLEYASYVIKDRAIPHIDDGLKPVQRRILHSLLEMDDGKFHKVANVVGHCMQYHPHGDQSINSALVVLANKELFIDKQGNFGNINTGDQASAPRYIECRILPLAKDVLYNPQLTAYEPSYDGRRKEPVTFPAKVPVVLMVGAEGIAVGMSTRILPHNFNEVLDAVSRVLRGESTELYPDFLTGGLVDVSEYADGLGKVVVRAKLDTKDPKRIVIRELPFGTNTESLINSIESAARKGKIKIAGITDYTTEKVEIEIKLARGAYSQEVEDALYAFTDCEMSISVNPLVIRDNKPQVVPISEIVRYHAETLVRILREELELEDRTLRDRLHARTLEQIFVEERIYKEIEQRKTQAGVVSAVIEGFKPFAKQIKRKVTEEDVERLLRIPIRRISLYDINKAKKEMEEIRSRLKEVAHHLNHLVEYAIGFLDDIRERYGPSYPRGTEIASFGKTDVRAVVQRNLSLRYDEKTGYLGYEVATGKELFKVSDYDRVLVVRASGVYSVIDAPEKLFVGTGMLFCGFADKESLQQKIFTIIYRNDENQYPYIKRCVIEGYIIGKPYSIVPDKSTVLRLTTRQDVNVVVKYVKNPRLKILEESFPVQDFLVKSVRASGVRLAPKPVQSVKLVATKSTKARGAASGNGQDRNTRGAGNAGGSSRPKKSGGSARPSSSSKRTRGGSDKKKS